jgi:hypothetical protein
MEAIFNRLVFEDLVTPFESPIEVHVEGFESDAHPDVGVMVEITVRSQSDQRVISSQQVRAPSWEFFGEKPDASAAVDQLGDPGGLPR